MLCGPRLAKKRAAQLEAAGRPNSPPRSLRLEPVPRPVAAIPQAFATAPRKTALRGACTSAAAHIGMPPPSPSALAVLAGVALFLAAGYQVIRCALSRRPSWR